MKRLKKVLEKVKDAGIEEVPVWGQGSQLLGMNHQRRHG